MVTLQSMFSRTTIGSYMVVTHQRYGDPAMKTTDRIKELDKVVTHQRYGDPAILNIELLKPADKS